MDDSREALTDVDRLLADALNVDVPPEFSARVHRRIAATGSRPAAQWGWGVAWPSAAAAAALIAASVLTMRLNRDAPHAPTALAGRPLAVESMRPANGAPARNVMAPATLTRATRARALPPAATGTEPEILVPREEIAMYRRLMAQAERVPQAVVVESPPDVAPPSLITDLAIEPIKIDPIMPPPDGGERDRQQ